MSSDSWTFPQDLLKKIPPQHFLHVLDNNTNVVRVELGPQTYRCKDQESAVYGPTRMIVIPPRHYVVVKNPVVFRKTAYGVEVVYDKFGQATLRHGDSEVRLEQDPFPLYPGEVISDKISPLEIVEANTALRLQATRDFIDRYAVDENSLSIKRFAGDEWYFEGPNTYVPQPEIKILKTVKAVVLPPKHALRLTTQTDFVDRTGVHRVAGSIWHYTKEGFYLPSIEEQIIKIDEPHILTEKTALHLSALYNFVDCFGVERRAGSQWLVTNEMSVAHIPDVKAVVKGTLTVTSLGKREYIVIQNPVGEDGSIKYGEKKVVKGERNFFLFPGEKIVQTPTLVWVLTADQALHVQALKSFTDDSTGSRIRRKAGEIWLIEGPKEYWPPLEVKVNRSVPGITLFGSITLFKLDIVIFYIILVIILLYLLWTFLF